MNKLALAIAAGLALAGIASGAHIGDEVQANVPFASRVNVPENIPVAITQITLEDGVWSISGAVTFYQLKSTDGMLFTSANISVDTIGLTVDGFSPFESRIVNGWNVTEPLSMPDRAIDINGTKTVYLVGWSHQQSLTTPLPVSAFGFISARKIRNHH